MRGRQDQLPCLLQRIAEFLLDLAGIQELLELGEPEIDGPNFWNTCKLSTYSKRSAYGRETGW